MSVSRVLVEKNISIPLRDGIVTRADLYRPADGPATPAIVTRTPYDKERTGAGLVAVMPSALKMAERGYAVVVQDTRGRYASEGVFEPFMDEGPDGYDTIEWIAAQQWCEGGVAIYGPSYVGATTMLAAREQPPSLKCAIPIITADDYYDGWTYQGGAYQLGFATLWGMGLATALFEGQERGLDPAHRTELIAALNAAPATLARRPLSAIAGISNEVAPWWKDWIAQERRSDYWERVRPSAEYSRFNVPMFHVGGWFDIFGLGTVRNFRGISDASVAPQHLLMGPWAHTYYDRYLGELDFGTTGGANDAGVVGLYARFLDRHLRGRETTIPTVTYFVMGANEWRTSESWPPPEATPQRWYLHSDGAANSARGDGALTIEAARGSETPDRYLYNPDRPVPTEGGATLQGGVGLPGPRDQRAVEARDDVLCYTSAALNVPLTLAGPVEVSLWAVTDAPDTDFTAKLVDVHPDGRAVSLSDGILRARFRDSFSEPSAVVPGEPTCYRIDLASTAYRFAEGHRVRLEISSSNFPRFAANPNTGGPLATEAKVRPAFQEVLHDSGHPSALECFALPAG
ncbi:MAG: CocE/NonD family hydrolase [Chloroflexi bacterium]|nr:CocE/NonD family hydrolase [Chloroflexota bacterium]